MTLSENTTDKNCALIQFIFRQGFNTLVTCGILNTTCLHIDCCFLIFDIPGVE